MFTSFYRPGCSLRAVIRELRFTALSVTTCISIPKDCRPTKESYCLRDFESSCKLKLRKQATSIAMRTYRLRSFESVFELKLYEPSI